VRALEESGVLAGRRGAYRLARPLASVNVPATVSALLAERIDRLPPGTKDILQAAAVIGRDVPAEVLVAVAGGSEAAVRGALGELCAAGLLHETAAFPEPIYAFTHGLAHEVAYGGLLLQRRRHLHALALEALERRGRDGRAEPVERLARHAVLGEVRERAVGYLLDAGRRAAARSAFSEALEHLGTGLELLVALPAGDARDRQELDLQLSLGRVAMASKGYTAPETERAYARARQLGQRVGDTRQVGPALAGQWAFHLLKARYPVARALAEQLLALAAEAGDPLLKAVAHRALGMTFLHEGTFARARQHLEQALAIYDPETHHERAVSEYGGDPHVACLAYLGRTLWFLGYPDQALARAREAVAQARAWSGALGVAQALGMLTSVHQTRRDMDDMREAIDRALAYASERGVSYWKARDVILASWVEAMSATGAGLRRSIERMRESLATYRGTETTLGLSWFTSLLAEPLAAAGDPDGGLAALDEALAHVADTGERFCEAEIHRLRGDLLIARGGAGAEASAEAAWRRALEIARSQQAQGWALRAATCLARLLARRGETRAARDVLGPIHGWFTEGFATADLRDAADVLAELDATVESYPGGVARRRSSSA
jgi:predicted ATPase